MKRGARTGALDGVPLAVKDAQRLKGKRTTQGSLIFKDWVDDHSDPMIERLQKAGAVILARTTTPEFCLSGITASRIWVFAFRTSVSENCMHRPCRLPTGLIGRMAALRQPFLQLPFAPGA